MKSGKTLSESHQCYITGNLSKKDFEGILFQYVLGNHERYRIDRDKSNWEDFVCWLYPRLVRAIDLYRDMGSSFDAYITALVHGASKEYRCREADHRLTEYACWQAKAQEMCVREESESEYPEYRNDICIPKGIKPRQILLLLLKSYYFASDDLVGKVSQAIGMETEAVMKMINELRKLRYEKEIEMMNLRDRIYCQHYRCLAYQKRMDSAQSGTAYRKKMELRCERARQRFFSMKKRLSGMRVGPSNRMIADVMGIPKGTVDSGLFAIKNHLVSFSDKAYTG